MAFPSWYDDKFGPHTVELYRDEVRGTGPQVEALASIAGPTAGGPILDLCCGWGRHAIPMARRGYRVLALDGSRFFTEKLSSDATSADKRRIHQVRSDMRAIPLASGSVKFAYQIYTSFGYGTDGGDDPLVLSEVFRVLRPGATYLLDLINWTLARRAFDGKFEEEYPEFDVVEEGRIDTATDILRVRRALLYRDGRPNHHYEFEIRMFDRARLTFMLEAAGFTVADFWGGFDKSHYSPTRSLRMIAICRKGEAR
jgi:SAM-dependent methyltransferase